MPRSAESDPSFYSAADGMLDETVSPQEYDRLSSSSRQTAASAVRPVAAYPSESEFDYDDEDGFETDVTPAKTRSSAETRLLKSSPPRARRTREFSEEAPSRGKRNAASAKSTSSRSSSRKSASKARPKKRSASASKKSELSRALVFEVTGILILTVSVVLLFNTLRPSADGFLTRIGVSGLRYLFGLGAPLFIGVFCVLGLVLIAYRQRTNFHGFGRGMGTAFLIFLTAVHLRAPHGAEFAPDILTSHGGVFGGALSFLLRRALGDFGAALALGAFSLVALLLFTGTSISGMAGGLSRWFKSTFGVPQLGKLRSRAAQRYQEVFDQEDEETGTGTEAGAELETEERWSERTNEDFPNERFSETPGLPPEQITPFEPIEELLKNGAVPEFQKKSAEAAPSPAQPPAESKATNENEVAAADAASSSALVLPGTEEESENPIEALEAQAMASATGGEKPKAARPQGERRRFGDGPLMPEYFDDALNALDPPVPMELGALDEDATRGVQHVEDTLKAFRIDARVTDVKRGPVITRYEVQPAPGVRVATIANLDRDLARSLSAYAVRIEAPVPGRNVVGIEVPNKKVHLVRMRDVLEVPEFLSAKSKLSFVLGKDIAGQPKWADLTKMPHMLIAGATNSGKSVCLNSIIASILLRAAPDEVKFSLIDPKRVELTLFRDIPHLYHPVVVEPKDAVRALRGAIEEMDRRYKLFAKRGVRNVASFNSKLEEGEEPLPYLVIVIDELADLMMTAAAEFEKLICRIAQLARATGIHLIVATQRPSVNVITGVIKANIPARIAFAVASQVDSRTILDSVGAERLIGSGDMLFDANTGGKSVRIQGAYLSEEEVNRVVEVVKERYADRGDEFGYGLDLASVDTGDSKVGEEGDSGASDEKRDELYEEVKEFALNYDEMSASLIQRRFEIGYPRAGRIVDQLERNGILGPADGPKPRKVLAGRQ